MFPLEMFENFIPQNTGNAPTTHNIPAVQGNFSTKELCFDYGSVVTSNLPNEYLVFNNWLPGSRISTFIQNCILSGINCKTLSLITM